MSNFGDMMRRARADAEEGDWTPAPGTHDAIVDDGRVRVQQRDRHAYAKTTLGSSPTRPTSARGIT